MPDLEKPQSKTMVIEIPEAVGVFDTLEDLQHAFYDHHMIGIIVPGSVCWGMKRL